MAHFASSTLSKPTHFNFSKDVVDFWAEETPESEAMYWVSEDLKTERRLKYSYFSRQSRRIAVLFANLGIKRGEAVVIVLPRVPEVCKFRSGSYFDLIREQELLLEFQSHK